MEHYAAIDVSLEWSSVIFRSAIDQPERFAKSKAVGAHFGLTPKKYQSGEIDWTGRISKLGEAQSQLLQSEKMASIGVLAAGVAHEINNPVGFVNSNLGTLQRLVAKTPDIVNVEVPGESWSKMGEVTVG